MFYFKCVSILIELKYISYLFNFICLLSPTEILFTVPIKLSQCQSALYRWRIGESRASQGIDVLWLKTHTIARFTDSQNYIEIVQYTEGVEKSLEYLCHTKSPCILMEGMYKCRFNMLWLIFNY